MGERDGRSGCRIAGRTGRWIRGRAAAALRRDLCVAWIGLPIGLANLWLTGFLARRFASQALSGVIGGAIAMVAVKLSLVAVGGVAVLAALLLLVV